MTLTNFHFTHWDKNHVVEKLDLADVPALYEALKTRFGLGVDDAKYGFSEAELAAVMSAVMGSITGARQMTMTAISHIQGRPLNGPGPSERKPGRAFPSLPATPAAPPTRRPSPPPAPLR